MSMSYNIKCDNDKGRVTIDRNGFSERVIWEGAPCQAIDAARAALAAIEYYNEASVKLTEIDRVK